MGGLKKTIQTNLFDRNAQGRILIIVETKFTVPKIEAIPDECSEKIDKSDVTVDTFRRYCRKALGRKIIRNLL